MHEQLPVSALKASPTNPRSSLGDLSELIASVQAQGIIEAILVRPLPPEGRKRKVTEWEIVAGHRRHAAAQSVGLDTVLAQIRDLTDDQVLELQLVENIQRRNLDPLDEARHYQRMLDAGYDVARIADKIGRSKSYVVQRLHLLTLTPGCRDAMDAGHLTLAVALQIARLPEPLQEEALEHVGGNDHGDPCLRASDARRELQARFMLRLSDAPFPVTDDELLPEAGACSKCHKHTGNQRALFEDVESDDLCVDPPCFRRKLDAHWKLQAAHHAEQGLQTFEGDAAKSALAYGSKYKRLDSAVWAGDDNVSIKELLGSPEVVAVAQDPDTGRPVELVSAKEVDRAVQERRGKKNKASPGPSAAEKKEALARKVRKAAIQEVIEHCAGRNFEHDVLVPLLTRTLALSVWAELQNAMIKHRKIELDPKLGTDSLAAHIRTATEIRGLALELVVRQVAPAADDPYRPERDKVWAEVLELLQLDFKKIERDVAKSLNKKGAKK